MTKLPEIPRAERGARRRALASDKAERADQHRAAIRQFVAEQGITISELARRMGLTNANAFYNFLKGRSSDLSIATLVRICESFPGTTLDQLVGRDSQPARHVSPSVVENVDPDSAVEPVVHDSSDQRGADVNLQTALGDFARSLAALRGAADIVEQDLQKLALRLPL